MRWRNFPYSIAFRTEVTRRKRRFLAAAFVASVTYAVIGEVWDVEARERELVLRGHESTVCSVVADETKIVSGAADKVRYD